MLRVSATRLQGMLVIVLFLGSLSLLLLNAFTTLLLPRREQVVRGRLQGAGRALAAAARPEAGPLPPPGPARDEVGHRLREVTRRVLRDYPGVEGGFYL